jgi:hypothetical protein
MLHAPRGGRSGGPANRAMESTMEHVAQLEAFWEAAPSAGQIFAYVAAAPQLAGHTLEFDYGLVDRASSRAVAKFRCLNCPTCRDGTVWVSALTRLDGTWAVQHTVGSIE